MCGNSAVLDLQREPGQALQDGPIEGRFVLLGCVVLEGRRVAVAQVGEELGRRLDEVHVVTVSLLGLRAVGAVVRALGGDAVGDQSGVLALEEVELARDDVGEALAEDHASSRYSSRCAAAARSHVSSSRARRAPARAASSAAGSSRSSRAAAGRASTSPAATTRPAPKRRTGSPIPPTSNAIAGTPAPSARS